MKRFSLRDTLLMLAPVAVLGIFGWLLSARKPAVIRPLGPFQPFIQRVQVLPSRPVDVFDGYDTRVIVEFGARGRLPSWWSSGGNSYSSGDGGQLVHVKGAFTASLGRRGYFDSPHRDFKSKNWVSTYYLKLRNISPRSGQIRLRDTLKFTDRTNKVLTQLWLDAPVRADGVAAKFPAVSHDACVKIEKFSIDSTPPIESHDGVERWRVKWTVLENIPRAGAENNSLGVNMNVDIVNGQRVQVGSEGRSEFSSQDSGEIGFTPNNEPRRNYITEDYSLGLGVTAAKPKEPLWLQGSIRFGDKWPLAVKIPLRDGAGKMLFTPRTATVPFRVVSVAKVVPTPDEVKNSGADAIVSVLLQAWNASADVSKWQWETNYSQHVQSSQVGEFWEFPFTSGKAVMGLTSIWRSDNSCIELRYPMVLKSIPASAGKLAFHADVAAGGSRRVPVEVTLRP